MPFGLMNAGATCQRKVDKTCQDLKSLFGYLDDLLVGSRTVKEHLQLLELLFERLKKAGLVLNMEKCEFGVSTCEFLGHMVSEKGILPMPKHLGAIETFPAPTCKKTLMSFLGMFNYYRSFVVNAAAILAPLTDALIGGPKTPFVWTSEMQNAFEKAKKSLKEISHLGFPGLGQELSLQVDASNTHVGGVLQQRTSVEALWEPLGFFSKKLKTAQLNYSAFDRELLAVV
jgi:cleavage and polyadenylation specificity factor subunit 1